MMTTFHSMTRSSNLVLAILCMTAFMAGCTVAPQPLASGAENIHPATAMTAKTEYITLHDETIAYRSFGAGEPILLLNRLRGTLDTWDPLFLDTLAATHALIIVDYPGVGYSSGTLPPDMSATAEFVADFATSMGLPEFSMLGWSWGGLVAQTVAFEHPDRVSKMVLIGTSPPGENALPVKKIFLDRAFKPVNDLEDEEILFFEPDSAKSREAARQSHDRIYQRQGVIEKIPSTPEAIMAYLNAASSFREDKMHHRDTLLSTQLPILVISGDNDPSAQVGNWLALVDQMKSFNLVVYPDAGHAPQHQYPELTVATINAFLEHAGD